MTVLVLTEPMDVTADLVVIALQRRGVRVHRVDTADFPQQLALTATIGGEHQRWSGTLADAYRTSDLGDITAVYYRRPGPFRMPDGLTGHALRWAESEARLGFGGVLAALPARWVNHPTVNAAADFKPRQLAAAIGVGLTVPPTLATNDPEAAREFAAKAPNGVVCKTFHQRPYQDPESGEVRGIPTTRVTADEIPDTVAHTAHQFQHWVDKEYEVRVTVVGRRLFAARIDAGSDEAQVDWRSDYDSLSYETVDLPEGVANRLLALTHTLGLTFAAVDLAVTPTGDWVFFELNPNGQWAWLQEACGLPIARCIAEELEPNR